MAGHVNIKWNIKASTAATNTTNPLRAITDTNKIAPNPDKPLLNLSIGILFLYIYNF